jgi:putative tryptophan/tyrosine transport system substrate-binding protein
MKRREFMTLLGGATAWPLVGRAQPASKLPTIGLLGSSTQAAMSQWVAVFVQRLRELGWIEGRSVMIEYRWAEGRANRFSEIAEEFVRLKVDVIVTHATEATLAAKRATSVIPIVFPVAGDPIGTGLVADLARPGGNVTGLSLQQSETTGKRLELFREAVPGLRTLADLVNMGNPAAVRGANEALAAARTIGLQVVTLEIRRAADIAPAFESIKGNVEGLQVGADPLVFANIGRITALALTARLPIVSNGREYIESGGLLSYGPSYPDLYRRAASYVDKILHGAKPTDLPVEQPTKFDLVLNLITARDLGLTIPPLLLARADEVIE